MLLPFEADCWQWGAAEPRSGRHLGRHCVAASGFAAVLADLELEDGTIELELAVGPERAFHGVVWRAQDTENYESFFVRPHQVGKPDAVQYTPVFNDISCWQLYHGDGFWAPVAFPIGDWFRIRVAFSGARAEVFVGDLERPALACDLKAAALPGRVGVLVGGGEVYLAEFAYERTAAFIAPPRAMEPDPQALRVWEVSDPFREDEAARAPLEPRTWSAIECEPSGLVNLARAHGIRDDRKTVLARTIVDAPCAELRALELGFSDRARVWLNGRPLFRGDDTYRSRDYRFLGSIGWHDALYLPLVEGANELVVAVSEDFGGWGVQARWAD